MRKKLVLLISSLCILAIASCEKKVGKLVEVTPPISQNACDTVTYEKHIKPIFTDNCAFCHAPGTLSSGFDLSTYALLKAKASSGALKQRVIVDSPPNSMPKGSSSKLPKAQLDLIQCWLDNGAKEK